MKILPIQTGIVLGVLFFVVAAAQGNISAMSQEKPNIIFIMADDLGFETIGAYGGSSYPTPHLDRMAEQGMRFTHAYSTPLCTPSRVKIMTGKYNYRNYIGFGLLDPAERTFGHLLQEAGYETAIAGKWQLLGREYQQHLAGNRRGSYPTEAGFSEYMLWQIDERKSRYKNPLLASDGQGNKFYQGKYGPDLFLEFIESYMEEHRSEPFFLYYPMVLPHFPFQPTPDNSGFADFDSVSSVNDPRYFGEMVTYMDKIVGQIRKKTEELGIEERTLILFVGDNGTDRNVTSRWNGQAIDGHKGYPDEYGTHVPFIAYWKGQIEPGQVNDNLIDFSDFLPTLMDVAGAEIPDDFHTDGISFYPQLQGRFWEAREWVFTHYNPNWGDFPFVRYVHNKEWKLYENGEFYHIADDPREQNPIPMDQLTPEQKEIRNKFQGILHRLQ
ncbi:MAG: sulfatase-like hydrolase/transferase [Balneolaceae bacterium]|nr:sulfatase-like hydrolase/transferase [Balneolaceae bacterium]